MAIEFEPSIRAPPSPEHDAELVGAAETLVHMANSGDFNIHNPPTAMHTATNAAAPPAVAARLRRVAPPHSCNECGKVFDSYQALGGHKSSHRVKRRVKNRVAAAAKPVEKVHVCHICSMEFKIGQALGGHMRKHYEPPSAPPTSQLGVAGDDTGESSSGGASSQEAVGKTTDFNVAPNLEICLDRLDAILEKRIVIGKN